MALGDKVPLWASKLTVSGNPTDVQGTLCHNRDLLHLVDKLDPLGRAELAKQRRFGGVQHIEPGMKWCYVCGDVRPLSYFSPGSQGRCKACERARQRAFYRESVGRPVRAYRRQDAPHVEAG